MPESFTSTTQWRRIRKEVLEEAEYVCRIRGPRCQHTANQVDHIIPVEDGGAIFDKGNLRAACGQCNNWRAAKQKHAEGWRRGRAYIVLVVGPPAAGKSTYIASHVGSHDLVIDYDALGAAMGGASHQEINAARNALISRVRRGDVDADRVWINSANPKAEQMFPHHEAVVVDPGEDEVMRRCATERPASYMRVVEDWYAGRTESGRREW